MDKTIDAVNLTDKESIIVNDDVDSLQDNEELLAALTKQLQYYFSPKNLEKDTYLNTIMQLNSGFVPVSILVNFANVNRIIGRFASVMGINDIADISVANLLRKSVLTSPSTLKIVLLNQDGKILASHGDDKFESLKKGGLTFEAFGRSVSENNDSTDESKKEILGVSTSDTDNKKANSTVILRDVPESATENDIHSIFKKSASNKSVANPIITSAQKDVGKCWFVTFDASTSQQDLVSILLDLRSKTICDEPIKARLKQTSAATSQASSIAQNSGFNPYRGRYSSHRNNTYPIYSGDRAGYYSRKYNARSHSKQKGGRGSDSVGSFRGGNEQNKKNKINEKVTFPPPPLIEEHFPGLGSSPKSTILARHYENEGVGDKRAVVTTASGYAAALLKAAPPVPEFSPSDKTLTCKPETPARKGIVEINKSTVTISTEDCSADDKSSLSSKPESESHNSIPSVSWGGGRSFADILKKQDV